MKNVSYFYFKTKQTFWPTEYLEMILLHVWVFFFSLFCLCCPLYLESAMIPSLIQPSQINTDIYSVAHFPPHTPLPIKIP